MNNPLSHAQTDSFYLQDSRSYVGNAVLWWARDGHGYTCDIRRAHVYTKEEADKMNRDRKTDIPWPKEFVDKYQMPVLDIQLKSELDRWLKGAHVNLSAQAEAQHSEIQVLRSRIMEFSKESKVLLERIAKLTLENARLSRENVALRAEHAATHQVLSDLMATIAGVKKSAL